MHPPFRVDTSRVNAPAFLRQSPLGRPDLRSLSPPSHRLGLLNSRPPIHLPSASQRTCTSIAMTAALKGATIANHVEVLELLFDSDGKACGAKCVDKLSGAKFDVHSKVTLAPPHPTPFLARPCCLSPPPL